MVNVTLVLGAKLLVHVDPQSIPPGDPVIVPTPAPVFEVVRSNSACGVNKKDLPGSVNTLPYAAVRLVTAVPEPSPRERPEP
jgi:hypothetical protein